MFKVATGPMMNLVGRGAGYGASASGAALSVSLDAAFPLSNMYDGRPSSPAKLAAVSSGFYLRFPNNLVPNGDFELSSLTEWSAGSATLTTETGAGNFHKGTRSIKVVTSAIGGHAKSGVITLQSGHYYQLWAAAKSDGTNATTLRLDCIDTNKSLNSSGAWDTLYTSCFSKTANTMAAFGPITFRAPTHSEVGRATVGVQIVAAGAANGQTFYWDEILIVPGINFVSVHGHNIQPSGLIVTETTGASYWHAPTSAAGGVPQFAVGTRQTPYGYASSMWYEPFPTIVCVPTGVWGSGVTRQEVPYIGELVVGQALELARNPDYPFTIEYIEPNARMSAANGAQWVLPRGSWPTRKVTMSFAYGTDAQYQEARDQLYTMSRGGAYPLVLLPTETDSGEAIFGRLEDVTTFRRDSFAQRMAEFIVVEEPFPWM